MTDFHNLVPSAPAGRFEGIQRPYSPEDVQRLRSEHRGAVLAAGAVLAVLVLVPVLNLITPIFGAAMMVHLHKKLMQDPSKRLSQRPHDRASIEAR